MTIYRGAGGSGDATNDATVTAVAAYAAQAATSATNSANSATTSESSATNSASSASNAAASASAAATSASQAASSQSAAATSATTAANSATTAGTQATVATNQANDAANSATLAYNNASTATTKAAEAATSASNAATSATDSANSAASALAIYGNTTAMNNAVTSATTSAANAAISASQAATSSGTASDFATQAGIYSGQAGSYASAAANSASDAATSANNAASIYGGISAVNAAVTQAQTSATASSAYSVTAQTAADTATTQATNAANSATQAANSAASAAAIVTGVASNRPSIRPSLLLDFSNTKQLDPRITFSRPTTATYYDGKTVVKAEENLLTRSQEFDNATSWNNPTRVTISANSTAAPDGTTTADTLVETATTGSHFLGSATIPFVSGSQYVFSVFAKNTSGGRGFINLIAFGPFAAGSYAQFNLSTGAVGTTSGMTASIVDVGNGWYRCIAIATATSSASERFYAVLSDGTAAQLPSYAGDITKGIFLWGAQLEQRSSVTAYTPTTTAPITNYIPALQTALAGVPRFDHDPVTGESKGFLIEEQRTNLLTYSEQFDNAAWSVNGTPVITANQVIAPDGTLTADTLSVSGSSNGFGVYRYVVSSGTYASSLYFKLMSGAFTLRLGLSGNFSEVNCSTLAITNTGTGVGSVFAVGNGWYRFVSVGTISALSASLIYNIGSNTGTLAIWGAQLEAGSFPTSYIPTVASQVTRSADSASMTGSNFSSWYRADEGTVYAEATPFNTSTNYLYALGTSTDMLGRRGDYGIASSNNVTTCTIASTATGGVLEKTALAYKVNDFAFSRNGGTVGTDTTGAVPNQYTTSSLSLGRFVDGTTYNTCTIKRIAYYPKRLSNQELQGLTS